MAPIHGLCAPKVCSDPPTPARLSPGAVDVFGTEESHPTLTPSTMQLTCPRTQDGADGGEWVAGAAALTLGPLPPVGPQVPEVTAPAPDAGGADVASRFLPKQRVP